MRGWPRDPSQVDDAGRWSPVCVGERTHVGTCCTRLRYCCRRPEYFQMVVFLGLDAKNFGPWGGRYQACPIAVAGRRSVPKGQKGERYPRAGRRRHARSGRRSRHDEQRCQQGPGGQRVHHEGEKRDADNRKPATEAALHEGDDEYAGKGQELGRRFEHEALLLIRRTARARCAASAHSRSR